MRISARAFSASTLLLYLVAGPLIPELCAAPLTVTYSGTVTSASTSATLHTGVIAGDTITGSFSYDPTQAGSTSTGIYTFTGSGKVHTMTFKIFNGGGMQVFTDSYPASSTPFYRAQVASSTATGTTLDLLGDTSYKEGLGVTGPGPPPAFDITLFNPTSGGGFSPTNLPLPTAATMAFFIRNTGTLKWDPNHQDFTASITTFNLQMVPEPSSLVMSVMAILTCTAGFLVCRRKRAGAIQRG